MIQNFGNKATEDLFHGISSRETRKFPSNLIKVVVRKLDMLNAADQLDDLRVPPGNRLEALKGDLKGFYSIRVNDQWRIIFQWKNGNALAVEIVDYHN
ncbi:type II toxin-antitoxin system RelE/ParE family toxin [Planktothrix mougeotii]|uniref:Type II toxin-antitoxin system RelE/ParE family toxin n=1 Tax=Planktothrix mougeotii LEGE 06226 TaxID=1828728 RepID=A0ABR9UJP4_9CYAN|nr:type II toxin-antitoxin system RelE/ParE family toxin [Planktothrix mougeotii]MBE9146693.1 type II toxin-antitoxin system RelE/ParE family toxin [Planktothrix mougeotii LEGE 06226]